MDNAPFEYVVIRYSHFDHQPTAIIWAAHAFLLAPSRGLPRQCLYVITFLSDCLNLTTLSATGGTQGGVWIHQLTRRHSQAPFKKIKGAVQLVLFHPLKPHFFVAVSTLTSS
jgi:hypothetical protein